MEAKQTNTKEPKINKGTLYHLDNNNNENNNNNYNLYNNQGFW
jgi:hypothetical protein